VSAQLSLPANINGIAASYCYRFYFIFSHFHTFLPQTGSNTQQRIVDFVVPFWPSVHASTRLLLSVKINSTDAASWSTSLFRIFLHQVLVLNDASRCSLVLFYIYYWSVLEDLYPLYLTVLTRLVGLNYIFVFSLILLPLGSNT
jgi:hypothetical protein